MASISLQIKQTNPFEKIRGLISKVKPESLMLRTRFGIHTFGVRFPIDVLVLNSQSKVVKVRENLPSNTVFFWSPKFDRLLELPSGTIQKKKIKLGDTIKLTDHHR